MTSPTDIPTPQLMARALEQHRLGLLQQAEGFYRQVLAREPRHADATHFLGVLAAQSGHPEPALDLIECSIGLDPASGHYHVNRGNVLRSLGRRDEALQAYQAALRLAPGDVSAYVNLSNALREAGRLKDAAEAMDTAIRLQPESPELHNHRGTILADLGRTDDAIDAYERAIRLRGDYADAHVNLAHALGAGGRLGYAVIAARRGVELRPELAEGKINLGNALVSQGRVEEAIASWRAAVEQKPALFAAHSNVLLALHNREQDAKQMFDEHRRWNERYAAPRALRAAPHFCDMDPDRRLRVGYVSADLRNHPVGRFLLPVLERHDRTRFEVFCFSGVSAPDELTAQLRAAADQWHDTATLSDDALAERIREQKIDVLIDLAGHTSGNRLLALALKPAPVQATWLGYPDTTGLTAIDYRITDAVADPPDGPSAAFHTESLIRLDGCFLCLRLRDAKLPPLETPADRPVTFGCFNNFTKVSPQTIALWTGVLKASPASRLLLKSRGLADASTADYIRSVLTGQGLPMERVDLLSHTATNAEHLALYNRVDVALDTTPYNGTTTTCDALSMGVPVVTLAGQTHASRVSASLLTAAGIASGVARSAEDYVALATTLASGGIHTGEQRRDLREWVAASTLCDEVEFVRKLEAAYRTMWKKWCAL